MLHFDCDCEHENQLSQIIFILDLHLDADEPNFTLLHNVYVSKFGTKTEDWSLNEALKHGKEDN